MAETKIYLKDPFNRDISWIDQEVCETFAGAVLRGRRVADETALALAGNNHEKAALLREHLIGNAQFERLKQELIDTFGIEEFIKPKSRAEHIRDLEDRMEAESDNEVYAKLAKELRELRGWVQKPNDAPVQLGIQVNTNNQSVAINTSNPREAQRIYASLMQ